MYYTVNVTYEISKQDFMIRRKIAWFQASAAKYMISTLACIIHEFLDPRKCDGYVVPKRP
jgi:hypothetical protein